MILIFKYFLVIINNYNNIFNILTILFEYRIKYIFI